MSWVCLNGFLPGRLFVGAIIWWNCVVSSLIVSFLMWGSCWLFSQSSDCGCAFVSIRVVVSIVVVGLMIGCCPGCGSGRCAWLEAPVVGDLVLCETGRWSEGRVAGVPVVVVVAVV